MPAAECCHHSCQTQASRLSAHVLRFLGGSLLQDTSREIPKHFTGCLPDSPSMHEWGAMLGMPDRNRDTREWHSWCLEVRSKPRNQSESYQVTELSVPSLVVSSEEVNPDFMRVSLPLSYFGFRTFISRDPFQNGGKKRVGKYRIVKWTWTSMVWGGIPSDFSWHSRVRWCFLRRLQSTQVRCSFPPFV